MVFSYNMNTPASVSCFASSPFSLSPSSASASWPFLPSSPVQLSSFSIPCNPSSSSQTSHNPLLSQSSAPSLSPSLILYLSLPLSFSPSSHLQPAGAPSSSSRSLPALVHFLSLYTSHSCLLSVFLPLSVSFCPRLLFGRQKLAGSPALPSSTEDSEALGTKTLSLEVSVYSVCVCVCRSVCVMVIHLHQAPLWEADGMTGVKKGTRGQKDVVVEDSCSAVVWQESEKMQKRQKRHRVRTMTACQRGKSERKAWKKRGNSDAVSRLWLLHQQKDKKKESDRVQGDGKSGKNGNEGVRKNKR